MPAFHDEHDGFWVSSHSTSKAIYCGTLCADTCHVHDAGRCTPCNPKHLSKSQTPVALRVTSQVVLPRSLLLSQSRCALRCMSQSHCVPRLIHASPVCAQVELPGQEPTSVAILESALMHASSLWALKPPENVEMRTPEQIMGLESRWWNFNSKTGRAAGTCPTLPSPPHAPASLRKCRPRPCLALLALRSGLCSLSPSIVRARLAPSQARRTSRAAPHALITARQLVRIGPRMPSHTPVPHPPTPSHAIPVPLPRPSLPSHLGC